MSNYPWALHKACLWTLTHNGNSAILKAGSTPTLCTSHSSAFKGSSWQGWTALVEPSKDYSVSGKQYCCIYETSKSNSLWKLLGLSHILQATHRSSFLPPVPLAVQEQTCWSSTSQWSLENAPAIISFAQLITRKKQTKKTWQEWRRGKSL